MHKSKVRANRGQTGKELFLGERKSCYVMCLGFLGAGRVEIEFSCCIATRKLIVYDREQRVFASVN